MNDVVDDLYEDRLASSGKLKLRAKALLAQGATETRFAACVLLHEAARREAGALAALSAAPPVTQLASAIEQCWCLVEGRNPHRAGKLWGHVLDAAAAVDDDTKEAMLVRLAPKYHAMHQEFLAAIHAAVALRATIESGSVIGGPPAQRARVRKELDAVLQGFPGASNFWWMAYRLAELDTEKKQAWTALSRACKLEPDNPRFEAMSLLVATWSLSRAEAEKHLAGARTGIDRRPPEVCLMYALAEIGLSRSAATPERLARLQRARAAADAGIAQRQSDTQYRNLKAVQLMTTELLAGREPTLDILYRAGLGELAATEKPNANVFELLTTRIRREAA